MLKKLFAHEWKDSWKLVTLFNIIVLVFTLIGTVAMSNESWIKAMNNNEWYAVVFVSYFMLYYFAILALGLATGFYFLMRFYKNFYTDQGYLMHTLPVSSSQLIISKALVMFIWQIISGIVIVLSVFALINGLIIGSGESLSLIDMFRELFAEIEFSPYSVAYCIIFILLMAGSQIFSIMFGYLAISLGQLSKNHKLLASIGIYVGMQAVLQFLGSVFQVAFSMGAANINIDDISDGLMIAILLLITIIIFALDFAMYSGSNYIMKNKLNLE